jgi:hypothetical protein
MKKIFTTIICVAIIIFILAGCNSGIKTSKYENLTVGAVDTLCEKPTEVYTINSAAYGMSATVARHPKCLGMEDLLLVSWKGPRTEKHDTAARLLMLMYVEYLDDKDGDKGIAGHYLKTDQQLVDKETTHMAFFQLRVEETEE